MDRPTLAKAIRATSWLSGHFVLRSGKTSATYFDKYLFESSAWLAARGAGWQGQRRHTAPPFVVLFRLLPRTFAEINEQKRYRQCGCIDDRRDRIKNTAAICCAAHSPLRIANRLVAACRHIICPQL